MGAFDCCRDCQSRTVNCHATCDIYLQAKSKHDKEVARIREKKKVDNYRASVIANYIEQNQNKKFNGWRRKQEWQ